MQTTLLFDSVHSAQEVAFILRGKWDEFNGVTVEELDLAALEFVVNQVQSEYCIQGDTCFLLGIITQLLKQNTSKIRPEELLSQYSSNLRDFQGADLSFINLSGANLAEINLRNASLYEANLKGTNLTNANLQDVILAGAKLERANLTGANLRNANLNGANLLRAKLIKANTTNASFEDAILDNANTLFIKLFVQNLIYAFQAFRDIRYFGYLYGWLSILLFGSAFIIAIAYLPLVAIVFSIVKGITIGSTTGLSIISLFIVWQYLENFKNKLINIPLESLLYILILGLIVSIIGELNHALREDNHVFISTIVGSIAVVGSTLSTWKWFRRMLLS